jgi:hypothetical protein
MRYQFVVIVLCSCDVNSRVPLICQSVRQPVTVVMQLKTYGDSQSRSKASEAAAVAQHIHNTFILLGRWRQLRPLHIYRTGPSAHLKS